MLKDDFNNLVYDINSEEALQLVAKNGEPVKYEVIQESGETIFVPSGWFHQVVMFTNPNNPNIDL